MQTVVDEGVGDAALMSIASKDMMAEMWPLLRKTLCACPESIRSTLLPEWSSSKRDLTAIRIAVKDDANADTTRWGVRIDVGDVAHEYPPDLYTVVLDWRHVADFLRHHPGIDVVVVDAACVRKPCIGVYYFEYAVVLALLHVRRWLVKYPCDLLAVFPDRRAARSGFNRFRLDGELFDRPFEGLMRANSGRIVVRGPKMVYWGKGVDARDTVRAVDPLHKIVMSVEEGSVLCVEAPVIDDVLAAVPRGASFHLVLVQRGESETSRHLVGREDGRRFLSVTIAGEGRFHLSPGEYDCVGRRDKTASLFVNGDGRPTVCVMWTTDDWMLMASSQAAIRSADVRAPTKEERETIAKRFPLMWEGLSF